MKFTAEVSELETTFLDTTVYKGQRFEKESILDVRTHYKPFSTQTTTAATQQALLRTNASKVVFDENFKNFKTRLVSRAYPSNLVDKILSEVNFAERKNALTQKQKVHKKILPFVTQF